MKTALNVDESRFARRRISHGKAESAIIGEQRCSQ
jgi:hypothetical protein